MKNVSRIHAYDGVDPALYENIPHEGELGTVAVALWEDRAEALAFCVEHGAPLILESVPPSGAAESFPVATALLPSSPSAQLRELALRSVGQGYRFVPFVQTDSQDLSKREIEVLTCLSGGLANKEIAARLAIGEGTVKFHLASIYQKLDAANRAEAVRRAYEKGILSVV